MVGVRLVAGIGAELVGAFEKPGRSSAEGAAARFSGRDDVGVVLRTFGIAPVLDDCARRACCCISCFSLS